MPPPSATIPVEVAPVFNLDVNPRLYYERALERRSREIQEVEDFRTLNFIMSSASSSFSTPNHDLSLLGPLPSQEASPEEKPLPRTRFERIVDA